MTQKEIFELLCSFLGFLFVSYTYVSTCLTGWVYDQELGLYSLNRVEAPLLNQIPFGGLICIASVDFICWNCAFDIVICLFLDLDSMSAQFFQARLQQVCIGIVKYFRRPHFSNSKTLQAFQFGLSFSCKFTLRFI